MLRRLLLAAGALALVSAPSKAHHGYTGRYNTAEPIWVEGVVASAEIGPPHIQVRVAVAQSQAAPPARKALDGLDGALRQQTPAPPLRVRADHAGQTVLLEFPPISNFTGLRGNLKPGDRVAAVVYRNCAAPHNLRVQWFRDGAGRALPGRRNVQTEVARC